MKNLPFGLLNSNEIYTTSWRINEACKLSVTGDGFIVTLCSNIDQANVDLTKGLGKSLNSDFTPLLLAQDQARDNAFIGFRDYASSFSHSSDSVMATAGRNLTGIVEAAGNTIHSLGYTAETAKVNSLIASLSAPAALKDIETIGATKWYEELKTSQDQFENLYKSKIDTESAIDLPLIKESKGRITKYLRALMSYIDINGELDPAKFGAINSKVDEILTEITAIARARETRKGNVLKKTEEAPV